MQAGKQPPWPTGDIRSSSADVLRPVLPAPASSLLERTGVTRQTSFWKECRLQTLALQSKILMSRPYPRELQSFMRCRTEEHIHTFFCQSCGQPHHFDFRCEKRFCPSCAVNLSQERKQVLEACCHLLKEPKHLVLTARNQESLKPMLRLVLGGVRKFLRRRLCSRIRGGWCSFEVTKESKGWHVHAHLLIDSPFLPADEVARVWASCVGQSFAIVKLKDCRRKEYLSEVTKYTVKPAQLLEWSFQEVCEFVKAIRARRMFLAFGHVAEASRAYRQNCKLAGKRRWQCTCGGMKLEPMPHK